MIIVLLLLFVLVVFVVVQQIGIMKCQQVIVIVLDMLVKSVQPIINV